MSLNAGFDIATIGKIAAFPTILEVVCRSTGLGFAAIAHVTKDRWVACGVRDEINFGVCAGSELAVETTFCHEIRMSGEPIIINHASADKNYCDHAIPALYKFESYISMPIILADKSFFGTLCAVGPKPANLDNAETIGMFKLFAELIAFHIDAKTRLASSEASLLDTRQASGLREEFIAVLGHDLRNPLASIDSGIRLLRKTSLDNRATEILDLMRNSVVRMSGLIENVMDFARGRLGGGLTLKRNADETLDFMLNQIIAEQRMNFPGRVIEATIDLPSPIDCDRGRVGQLFSNLLANALTYGSPAQPVKVKAIIRDSVFELSVANAGKPISPATMEQLFQPFSRGNARENQEGLGLGLYIASEIARAHDGTLTADSTAEETRFTFCLPLTAAPAQKVAL